MSRATSAAHGTHAPRSSDTGGGSGPDRASAGGGDGPGTSPVRRAGGWTAAAGLAVLGSAFALAALERAPARIFFYHLAWAGTLGAMAGGLAWRTGAWPLSWRGAVSLFFWSAPVWYLYELVNFRIENWYYVLIAREAPVRWVGTFLAFGTVLPALYLAYRWLRELGVARGGSRPRFRVRTAHLAASWGLGVVFVVLAHWRPRAFYPLVWGALTLLVDPWNFRRDPSRSLLGDLSRGRYTRIVRLLAGGLAIGALWEAYNAMAAARWIYTVPGLEDVKLFEMPLPGFLGFPLLALDGYVVYRALEGLGVAWPAWGRGDPSPANRSGPAAAPGGGGRERARPPARTGTRRTVIAAAGALLFCAGVQTGIDRWTLDSVYPRLEDVPGVTPERARRLRDAGIGDPEALAAADSARLAGPGTLGAEAAGAAVRGARLTMLRGMGAANARALWREGIRSVCDLAAARQDRVVSAVRAHRRTPRAGEPARVRVWLRAARERCGARHG